MLCLFKYRILQPFVDIFSLNTMMWRYSECSNVFYVLVYVYLCIKFPVAFLPAPLNGASAVNQMNSFLLMGGVGMTPPGKILR